MVVTLSVVGSSVVDPHSCPCLCLEALNHKSSGELNRINRVGKKHMTRSGGRGGPLELNSCFIDSWLPCKVLFSGNKISKKQRKNRTFLIVNEAAGQYDDSFEDVKTQILNYFTYKAVRTVLNQLYEMNPTQYRWFYDFVVTNKPGDGKRFIRTLGKEKQDLAERVMITRLHLYGKWAKKCDHAEIYQTLSDQNLQLMRERLKETVIWPSDDNNKEKIG